MTEYSPRRSALYMPGANARALEKAKGLNAGEIEGSEFAELMDDLRGEMQIAVDWIDGAFGEIEAEAVRLGPIAAFRTVLSRLFGN